MSEQVTLAVAYVTIPQEKASGNTTRYLLGPDSQNVNGQILYAQKDAIS
ncbi:hypothetical protein [Thiohalophilus thiocyanatoxydans]|uniref:Uncharacterized protein n=1 Tax=Thiohalophilus thiocyanatoxydans TaxID=381308 RepID=A0A4R8IP08_9GAMM|nr:hypothetical protein [Thiohalophilus thiocyanatoxydans]TDY02636.1 hypothetical protein EDC23_1011 [Thiohalophilus thiocyanatoxydans]